MFEESRIVQSAAGPEIDRLLRKKRKNPYEQYDVKIMRKQNMSLNYEGIGDLESHKSRTSEGQQLIHELRSETMQLQESAVQPNPTQDFVTQDLKVGMHRQEATIESRNAEFQKLQIDFETTKDSLNSWDKVNVSSIRGAYVDDSIGTATSSVSRLTVPAISHPAQAGWE